MQQTETPKKPARRSKVHRALFFATLLLAVLLGGGAAWWRALNVIPVVAIPTPILPSPNAFDFWSQASDHSQEGRKVAEAMETKPPAGQHLYTQAEREALLAKNAQALQELRAAFQQEYLAPPIRSAGALADAFPHFANFRNLARLLKFEGRVYAGREDWGRALQSSLDGIQFGVTVPRGASITGQLVGIACEAIGRADTWEVADKLNAAEAKSAAQRLEKILAKRVPFADTMEKEKQEGQAILLDTFHYSSWRIHSEPLDSDEDEEDDDSFGAEMGRFSHQTKLHFYSNATILNNYTHYMDAVSARVRQPYATWNRPSLPEPKDPYNARMAPTYMGAGFKDLTTRTLSDLLLLTLALRAYRQEQGAYPPKLDALVPAYLTKLPDDPFGTQTFQYRRASSKYLLYSVGPDTQDDGGKPIDDPSKASSSNLDVRHRIESGSKGDIVPGVNTY